MPVYLVSMIPRSGSSAVMAALAAGGMAVYSDGVHEVYNVAWGDEDYQPNPDGFHGNRVNVASPAFPLLFAGRCLKIDWHDLLALPAGDYRLLFMVRDPAAIDASMARFGIAWGRDRAIPTFYEPFVAELLMLVTRRLGPVGIRFDYDQLRADPLAAFERLAAAGWPVDPDKAAAVIR